MRLVSIINAWSDTLELLPYCIENTLKFSNKVIVAYSVTSNHGNKDERILELVFSNKLPVQWINIEPVLGKHPHYNEAYKRNMALNVAKQMDYSHFLMLDADEFYLSEEVQKEKIRIEEQRLNGLVCRTKVYFKKPTYCLPDHTLVPFIHNITPYISTGQFKRYPFAYDEQGNAHIDPTRRLSFTDKVEMSGIYMHHFSWVRKDFNLKIENSAARNNLKRSSIYRDLENAKEGVYNEFYRANIVTCDNLFNLPES